MFTAILLIFTTLLTGVLVWIARKQTKLEQEHWQLEQAHEQQGKQLQSYKARFAPITDVLQELARVNGLVHEQEELVGRLKTETEDLQAQAQELHRELEDHNRILYMAEAGVFEPTFKLETSEAYKKELEANRAKQKQMIADGKAVFGRVAWQLSGSQEEGNKMVKRAVQLTLRAFNNECEAGVANVTWANLDKTLARINKSFGDINKLNSYNQVTISEDFLNLKINELKIHQKWLQKKQAEKEEQARIRQQMRDEERERKAMEAAITKAAEEERRYQKLLEKAQQEAIEAATKAAQSHSVRDEERLRKLQAQVDSLSQQLATAHTQNLRAMSMAQQTRSGHVYIISNKGSFGEDVFKIGMTRRLEPQDRVDELGDASVPFCFDVHGMIFSDDAPGLESHLHKCFAHKRVNRINQRKEFFRVSLAEIQEEISKLQPGAELVTTMVAEEYHQSLALIQSEQTQTA